MLNATELLSIIETSFKHPGADHNPEYSGCRYLGMSMIGGCHAAAYDGYFGGVGRDDRMTWYSWVGRALEDAVKKMLQSQVYIEPGNSPHYEIVSPWSDKFVGHPDIIFSHGEKYIIADVKSVTWEKFRAMIVDGVEPSGFTKNVTQVQSYLSNSQLDVSCGALIYTPRDIPHFSWETEDFSLPYLPVVINYPSPDVIDRIKSHVFFMLDCIEQKNRPPCTCGYCGTDKEIPILGVNNYGSKLHL